MNMLPDWTEMTKEQRIEKLKPLVSEGLSAGQIAMHFGNCSRNAVIGYLSRHDVGYIGKGRTGQPVKVAKLVKKPVPARKSVPALPPIEQPKPVAKVIPDFADLGPIAKGSAFLPIDGVKPVHLTDLGRQQCHWPVNGLDGNEPIFCGAPSSKTYCTSHQRLAYQPRGQQGAL
jgi:hypothetical protein